MVIARNRITAPSRRTGRGHGCENGHDFAPPCLEKSRRVQRSLNAAVLSKGFSRFSGSYARLASKKHKKSRSEHSDPSALKTRKGAAQAHYMSADAQTRSFRTDRPFPLDAETNKRIIISETSFHFVLSTLHSIIPQRPLRNRIINFLTYCLRYVHRVISNAAEREIYPPPGLTSAAGLLYNENNSQT